MKTFFKILVFWFYPLILNATVYNTISSGNWSTGTNWDQGSAPTFAWNNTDTIYVKHNMTLTSNLTVGFSYVEITTNGQIDGGILYDLSYKDQSKIKNSGTIVVKDLKSEYYEASLYNYGVITANGSLVMNSNSDTLLNFNIIIVTNANVGGTDVLKNSGKFTVNGDFTNGGLSYNHDTLIINGNFTENSSISFNNSVNSFLQVAGLLSITSGGTNSNFYNEGSIETDSLEIKSDTLVNDYRLKVLNGALISGGYLKNTNGSIIYIVKNMRNTQAVINEGSIYIDGSLTNEGPISLNGDICNSDGVTPVPESGSGSNTNTVCQNGVNTYLPIELISFSAEFYNNNVLLEWETLSETNNLEFIVQRSLDAKNWSNIVSIAGAGNSNSLIKYSFIDYSTQKSGIIIYYRLKQLDYNEEFAFSKIKSVQVLIDDNLNIYPNPVKKGNVLTINNYSKNIDEITITSISGNTLYKIKASSINLFNTNVLAKGVYLIKTNNITRKLIVY